MTSLLRRSELAVPAANDHMFAKRRRVGGRPGLPRPRGRHRARAQGGGPRQSRHGAQRTRLGTHRAGDPHQRARHPVVPRRHRRGRHRRPGEPRHHHHPESASGPRCLVGRRAAHPAGGQARFVPPDPPRGAHRRGRGTGQRRGDRHRQPATGRADLRCRRLLAVPGCAGGHQLRPARRISRRLLGLRPQQGDRRRPHRRHRRDRRALPRLRQPGRATSATRDGPR